MGEDSNAVGRFEYANGLLDLEYTLTNGQMFRWRKSDDGWWDAVSGARLLRIRKLEGENDATDVFEFQTLPGTPDQEFLQRFLRFDVDLDALYMSWAEADPYLGGLAERFRGLRIVRQQPEECLLSFICSTANFIPNIMRSIAVVARTWGEPIISPEGKTMTHAFPRAGVLAELDPQEVAEKSGLEWRGANLVKVARQLAAKPDGWLQDVERMDYASARGELMRLEGVGPKIADCVCLFAMAKDQAVPVDTHVWQLTRDRYLPTLRGKTLTPSGYGQVLSFFRGRFEKAGWAQQYLFYDHLLESRAKRGRRS
jgi:N-glycosylase/DNA lyase